MTHGTRKTILFDTEISTIAYPHYKSDRKRVGQKIDEKVTFDYKNKVVRFLVKVQIAKEVYTKRRRL